MAKIKKVNKSNSNETAHDIRAINSIRKELGKRPMPIKQNKWYNDVVKFASSKYGANNELAIKMIAASMSPYMANKLNKTKGRTTAMLNTVVNKKGMANHSIDDAIRAQNVNFFESNQFNEMNHVQEAMLDSGQLDLRQVSNKIIETKLNGLRPR